MTSSPTRGRKKAPKLLLAHACATRTQQELSRFFFPSRSQKNWTLTRPYLSVEISPPAGPTTMAVCVPLIVGFGVARCGRKGIAAGIQGKGFFIHRGTGTLLVEVPS